MTISLQTRSGRGGNRTRLAEATGLQPATTPCDLSPRRLSERLYGPCSMTPALLSVVSMPRNEESRLSFLGGFQKGTIPLLLAASGILLLDPKKAR
jgi:hypothetical protein